MQAYLIDPDKFTIESVDYDGSLLAIYDLLNCDQVDVVTTTIDVVTTTIGLSIFIADDNSNRGSGFFRYLGCPPIRGKGLLLGPPDGGGETTECPLTMEEVYEFVSFPVMMRVL